MRDKRNEKKKLKEEKSLFFEFPRVTLTEIIATQPLSRDCATIVTRLFQYKRVRRLKREQRIEDNYSILRSIIRFRQSTIRIGVHLSDSGIELSDALS